MASRYDRWLKQETRRAEEALELTAEQIALIEKHNPAFKERHVESSRPGELLNQDTFYVDRSRVLPCVSSCRSGYLFELRLRFSPHHQATRGGRGRASQRWPFYRGKKIPLEAILTDNGLEFCGTESHPYELYLSLNDIEHRRTRVNTPRTNGFVERFNMTVLDEFFAEAFRKKLYSSTGAL